MLLPDWPFLSQLDATWTQDGRPAEDWMNDCGETCCSMILQWSLGKAVSPDAIKDGLYGESWLGYGYVSDLSYVLNSWGITTDYEEIPDADTAREGIIQRLDQGHPSIILIYSDRVARTGGHFVAGIGHDPDGAAPGSLVLANPWGGYQETVTPAAFKQAYNSWVIHTQATKLMPPQPQPPASYLASSQWLKSRPSIESAAVPKAHVPAGHKVAIESGTIKNAEGTWVKVGWGSKGVLYQGYVLSKFVTTA